MGRLCLIPCRTPLSGMTFNQFARKTITSLNGCQGMAAICMAAACNYQIFR